MVEYSTASPHNETITAEYSPPIIYGEMCRGLRRFAITAARKGLARVLNGHDPDSREDG